ncbi:uncharacterized protein TRIADDRAFT_52620 [Trichoplax adhaerens]|uniref:Uncharacterized protein n=1 Tax=Trichoplax adhaerens TaxID=10228 RepID=B3RJG8_TRIAD|nr:predicted protein [Trichoplax adhaerens]EDV29095.1 predicted protein [Trichoplax adhaerens]|eukprot:XP_002108297.1 predicted protein [Trichoplax adhaerens]
MHPRFFFKNGMITVSVGAASDNPSDSGNCSKTYHHFSNTIASPNFPDKYPVLSNCCWKIILNNTQSIFFRFLAFNVEYRLRCAFDYVMISPGSTANKTCDDIAATSSSSAMCGNNIPPPVQINSNIVYINFHSDSVNGDNTGFQLKYEGAFGPDTTKLYAIGVPNQVGNTYQVVEGKTFSLVCHFQVAVEGIDFQWYHRKNNSSSVSIMNTQSDISIYSNSTTSIITIPSMRSVDSGIYTCNASTALQSIKLSANLNFTPQPTTKPLSTAPSMVPTSSVATQFTVESLSCPTEVKEKILWPATTVGKIAKIKCIPPSEGLAFRQCLPLSNGAATWDIVDTTRCTTLVFVELNAKANTSLGDEQEKSQILQELSQITVANNSQPIQAGDMIITNNILGKIARESTIVTDIDQLEKQPGAAETIQNLDLFAGKYDLRDTYELTLTLPNLVMTLLDVPPEDKRPITFPANVTDTSVPWWNGNKITLPAALFSDRESLSRVTNFIYKSLNEFLPYSTDDETGDINNDPSVINSQVISSTIQNRTVTGSDQPVEIVLRHLKDKNTANTTHECVFWNFDNSYIAGGDWSNYGCRKNFSNATVTVCHCDHLTHFAVLVQVRNATISPPVLLSLQIITYVGCGISILCLLITLILYIILWKYFEGRVVIFIHFNLMLCLLMSNILIVSSLGLTKYKLICTMTTATLHFALIASFMWMLVEGLHAYIKIVRVFSSGIKLWLYFIIAYGSALAVVGATIGIAILAAGLPAYVGTFGCWLSIDPPIILGFLVPIGVIIMINIIFLILVLKEHITTVSKAPRKSDDKQVKLTKLVIKDLLILLPLLGSGWVLACLVFITNNVIMQYPFAIVNSLQGFFIFIFHCVRSEKVKKAWTTRKVKRMRIKTDIARKHQGLSTPQMTPKSTTKSSSVAASEARKSHLHGTKFVLEIEDADDDSLHSNPQVELSKETTNRYLTTAPATKNKRLGSTESLDQNSNDHLSISQSPFHRSETSLSQRSRNSIKSVNSPNDDENEDTDRLSQSNSHQSRLSIKSTHSDDSDRLNRSNSQSSYKAKNIDIDPTNNANDDETPVIIRNQMLTLDKNTKDGQQANTNNTYSIEVTNLNPDISRQDLEDYFQAFGAVISVGQINRKTNNLDGRARLFTTVVLKLSDTIEALLEHNHIINDCVIAIHHHSKPSSATDQYRVIVTGLNKSISREMLQAKFSEYGEISNIEFDNIYFPTSCCITFNDLNSYEHAISKRHSHIDGRHRISIMASTSVNRFF